MPAQCALRYLTIADPGGRLERRHNFDAQEAAGEEVTSKLLPGRLTRDTSRRSRLRRVVSALRTRHTSFCPFLVLSKTLSLRRHTLGFYDNYITRTATTVRRKSPSTD